MNYVNNKNPDLVELIEKVMDDDENNYSVISHQKNVLLEEGLIRSHKLPIRKYMERKTDFEIREIIDKKRNDLFDNQLSLELAKDMKDMADQKEKATLILKGVYECPKLNYTKSLKSLDEPIKHNYLKGFKKTIRKNRIYSQFGT